MQPEININTALELLRPAYLQFIGFAAATLLAIGSGVAFSKLRRPRDIKVLIATFCLLGLSVIALACLVIWTDGLKFGDTVHSRFTDLCESAGLTIHHRMKNARGILIRMPSHTRSQHNSLIRSPSPSILLTWAQIDFVEQESIESEKSVLSRITRPFSVENVQESLADIVVSGKSIVTQADLKVGIVGEELHIAERTSGRTLAIFRYFVASRGAQYCPRIKQGIDTAMIISYVIGLQNESLGEKLRDAFLP